MKRLLLLALAIPAWASSPAFWEMTTYADFIKGTFQSVALSRAGALTMAPRLESVFSPGQPYIWSIAQAPDGSIYAGTGNGGRLYRVDAAGRATLVWTAPQPEIFALACDSKGVLYAGTSPNGRVWRIENGKASEYFNPQSAYIWSLALGRDGALFAGTGGEGKIFRITSAAQGEVYYSTGQSHITGLTLDRDGALLAGSDPNGILYRVTAKDKAFALYDASLPEIRAIAMDADGSIYAVGLGGSVAKKAQSATQPNQAQPVTGVPSVTTSITVTAENAAANDVKPVAPADPAKAQQANQAAQTPAATGALEIAGVEKSAIYKIHPDHTVETLWSSKEENIYDLVALGDQIVFGTDVNGRIYRWTLDRKAALVAQTGDGEITRLFRAGSALLASTANGGRIWRLTDAPAAAGTYESPVFDATAVARWGHAHWQGSGKVTLQTRTGNSLRPDATWSDWSQPLTNDALVTSPNARYIMWRASLASADAEVAGVSIGYLTQNSPPAVRSITTLTTVAPAPQQAKNTGSTTAATSPYTVTVTDTGDAGPATSTGTPTQTLSRAGAQQIAISWQADDPDGDKLLYNLFFRGESEREWKPLKTNTHDNTFTMDGDALADGRYFFRVVASDREVNAATDAREAELVSSPVLIDNTPPVIALGTASAAGIDFTATDAVSTLKRAEYAIDGGAWTPLAPVEGILDSRTAHFHIDLTGRPAGEHLLVIRVADSGNNTGLAKVILH